MNSLSLKNVAENPYVLECIHESDKSLALMGYTDHGLRHVELVAQRAQTLSDGLSLENRVGELSAIASFCHDMGNFMGRTEHHYWGSLLFMNIFKHEMSPDELMTVVQAIANHDKEELKFTNSVGAILVIADKSDVHRSRVRKQPMKEILSDIHDRVNYAVTNSEIKIEEDKKRIVLALTVDIEFVPLIEYFEIFTVRMLYCRKAATYLGYTFGLTINNFVLA